MNHLTLKANGQLVAPLEKYVCKSHKKCSICLHVFTSTAQEHMKHCGRSQHSTTEVLPSTHHT